MSAAVIALVATAGALAVCDWVAVHRRAVRVEFAAKPAAMIALILTALVVHAERHEQRSVFVVALLLSLAGDVFLMLPSNLFVPGLASFLLAHVAYIVGLRLEPGANDVALALAFVAVTAVAVVVGGRVLRAVRRGPHRELVVPVAAYVTVISVMVASAFASGDPVAAVAAVLFYASDGLIAEQRFVQPRRWQPVTIMVTYHIAQALFVLSLAR